MGGVTVEVLTEELARERLLANLEDAGLTVSEFVEMRESWCHLSCARGWYDDRWVAIAEADRYWFLLDGWS